MEQGHCTTYYKEQEEEKKLLRANVIFHMIRLGVLNAVPETFSQLDKAVCALSAFHV